MAVLLPTLITHDPSHGYRVLPQPETTEFDLRVSFDVLGGDRIRASMSGPILPTLRGGDFRVDLDARPADIRGAAARLCERWRTVFVDYQPTQDGRPIPNRERPYAAAADLSGEPEDELRNAIAELARSGASMLFGTLLRGEGRRVETFRAYLARALASEGLRIRFNSSDLHLPWPMLCLRIQYVHNLQSELIRVRSSERTGTTAESVCPGADSMRCTCPEDTLSLDDLFTLFLGYRHQLEHAGDAFPWIPAGTPTPPSVPAVSLNHDTAVGTRIACVREVAGALMAGTKYTERKTYQELVRDFGAQVMDDQLMYFWCHGAFMPYGAEPAQLVIRLSDQTPFDGYTVRELRSQWEEGVFSPFVMLNACYAGTAFGDVDRSFLGRELIDHGAQGVLGPRIAMPQVFAAEYALRFINQYLSGGHDATAGKIVQALARDFADNYRNPLGLAYALHSGMDSRVIRIKEADIA